MYPAGRILLEQQKFELQDELLKHPTLTAICLWQYPNHRDRATLCLQRSAGQKVQLLSLPTTCLSICVLDKLAAEPNCMILWSLKTLMALYPNNSGHATNIHVDYVTCIGQFRHTEPLNFPRIRPKAEHPSHPLSLFRTQESPWCSHPVITQSKRTRQDLSNLSRTSLLSSFLCVKLLGSFS